MNYNPINARNRAETSAEKIFRWLFALPFLLDIFNSFLTYFGGLQTSNITLLIYGVLLCAMLAVIIRNNLLNGENFLVYSLVLLFFAGNYYFFPNIRQELLGTDMILIYLFFLPACCFIIPTIHNWSSFFEKLEKFSYFSVFATALLLISGANANLNYMKFSYSFLPFICTLIYLYAKKGKPSYLIFACVGIAEMIIFGARSPVFFALLCFIIVFFGRRITPQKLLVIGIFFSAVIIINISFDLITERLLQISRETDSYFLFNLLNGNIFKSTGRSIISENCKVAISNMGFNIYGLYGDRRFVYPEPYAHNIVYEVLLSFGWLFGIIFLGLLLYFITSSYSKADTDKKRIIIVVISAFLMRYFVSGSFVMEYQFYYCFAIIISIKRGMNIRENNYTQTKI